ncbi:hypothetical protein Goari_011518 [Gossypium aridum]|uniref:Uncharacterized protein n=1 Tax=Gossypium aridum TaxID=34290 RepID=A0A7J8WXL0_GOSAI|nr:hypothetical protein [Gossypium aridum]
MMLLSVKVVRRGLGKWRGKPVGKVRKQYLMRMKVKALESSLRLRFMKKSIVND